MASFEDSGGDPYPDPKVPFGVLENAWARKLTQDGRIYFSNRATGASQWHIPNEFYQNRCLRGESGAPPSADDDTVAMPGTARAVLNVDCMTEFVYNRQAMDGPTQQRTQLPEPASQSELPSETLMPEEAAAAAAVRGGKGGLRLTVVSARGLRDADFMPGKDKSDPFVKVEVMGRPGVLAKTEVVKDCLDPIWDHLFELRGFASDDIFVFSVWDEDGYKNQESDTLLGKVLVAVQDLQATQGQMELNLSDAGKNEAYLTIYVHGN